MINKNRITNDADVLMLGVTFKENCPDVRNTKIVDVESALADYCISVTVFDPLANPTEIKERYGTISTQELPNKKFDAIVLGVAQKEFLNINIEQLKKDKAVVYDVKGFLKESVAGL